MTRVRPNVADRYRRFRDEFGGITPFPAQSTALNTKAKLIEYLEEIDAERERAARHPG